MLQVLVPLFILLFNVFSLHAEQESPLPSWFAPFSAQGAKFVPYRIGYSIPEGKIVQQIPEKDRDFASIDPRIIQPYAYHEEDDYYRDYQWSYFAITKKKGGWDCLRHYEILANGCIPYFLDLDQCDEDTMYFLPKDLIQEAMHLEGVSCGAIDHSKFNREKYHEILEKLLQHTRKYLTSRKMAEYLLKTIHYSGRGNILFLAQNTTPEYLRDLTLIGLKHALERRVIDFPKIDYLYENYPKEAISQLYGRGMTYTRGLPDLQINRENIEERIRNHEFDLILYGELHNGSLPFYNLVKQYYTEDEIIYLYCEESPTPFFLCNVKNLFIREYHLYKQCPKPFIDLY